MAGSALIGRLLPIALLLVLITLAPVPAEAWQAEMSADSLEGKGDVFELEGNVVIQRDEFAIKAASARYDRATGDVMATGGFTYEDSSMNITAESAELNLETGQGTLYEAEVKFKEDGFRVSGAELRRTAPDRYFIRKGSVTTCEGLPPAWCFKGRDFDIEVGERLVGKGVTFRIRNVPVLYTPYVWVPIVTERRSGLLPPTLGYRDSTGAYYRQPIYWAPTRNRDATLYLDYHSSRAFGQGLEYRYVEGPRNKGRLYVYHLRDEELATDFYEGSAYHRAEGRDVEGFMDVNLVNHREFFRIYEPYVEQSSRRYTYSRAEVWGNLSTSRLYVHTRYYQDLQDGVPNDAVLQEIPGAGLHVSPLGLGPLVVGAEARAQKFRRDLGYEGERMDGVLSAILSLGRGPNLTQQGRARRVLYKVADAGEETEFENDHYEYLATATAIFTRPYGETTHAVEPSVYYDRRILNEEEVAPRFDDTELFTDVERTGFSLVNRFIGPTRERLTLRLVQEYDIREEKYADEPKPWRPLQVDLSAAGALGFSTAVFYDHYEEKIVRTETRLEFRSARTWVWIGHSYIRAQDQELYKFASSQRIGARWNLEAGFRYSDMGEEEQDEFEEISAAVTYKSQCWGLRLEGVQRPDDTTVYLTVNLKGLGEASIN